MIFVMIALLICSGAYFLMSNHHISLSVWEYHNDRVPESFCGFTILQLSDIHGDLPGKKADRMIRKIRKVAPDIVIITGDVIDDIHDRHYMRLLKLLNVLCQEFSTYYVTGNHEYMHIRNKEILGAMRKIFGSRFLKNEYCIIRKGTEAVCLSGLEDPYVLYGGRNPKKYKVLYEKYCKVIEKFYVDRNCFNILLSHRPEYFEQYSQKGFDLVFAGHAHGGQWRGLSGRGFIAPDQGIFPVYTHNWYEKGNTTMYVSRGLGNSIIPLRLFNDPEMIAVKLFR